MLACCRTQAAGNVTAPQLSIVRTAMRFFASLAQCRLLRDHLATQTAVLGCVFQPHILFSTDKKVPPSRVCDAQR